MEWSGVESRTQGKERARTVQNTSNRTTVRTNVQYKTQYSTDISILYVTRRFLLSLVVQYPYPFHLTGTILAGRERATVRLPVSYQLTSEVRYILLSSIVHLVPSLYIY